MKSYLNVFLGLTLLLSPHYSHADRDSYFKSPYDYMTNKDPYELIGDLISLLSKDPITQSSEDVFRQNFPPMKGIHSSITSLVVGNLSHETKLGLAKEAHDNGYWQQEMIVVNNPQSLELGAIIPENALKLLTETGRSVYQNRYETYATKGHKFTAGDLEINKLSIDGATAFFKACGKNPVASDIRSLVENPNKLVLSLFKQDFDSMANAGKQILNAESRSKWFTKIVENQIGAITSAVILAENLGHVGKFRNLDTPLQGAEAATLRSLYTWTIWKFAIQYQGLDGFAKNPQVRGPYEMLDGPTRKLDDVVEAAVRIAMIKFLKELKQSTDLKKLLYETWQDFVNDSTNAVEDIWLEKRGRLPEYSISASKDTAQKSLEKYKSLLGPIQEVFKAIQNIETQNSNLCKFLF